MSKLYESLVSGEMDAAIKLAEESLFKGGAEYSELDLNTLARALLSFKPLIEVLKKEIPHYAERDLFPLELDG